ncbi:uncharacterized protein EI97DRAFT_382065 [Westerdykella ornata]|uniref:Autophagy-related protein 17 n=1 Tax=Westerdykella ornata TaxID=318751 RepID=A0A6A6JDH4_WESOR|nr:uncharacterized protein EI97DRAFT_382065 [Westerdykella ornata]KAF2274048.1 hypothetical protein EI97DRAFT_382065 [Westerdykella ornata]
MMASPDSPAASVSSRSSSRASDHGRPLSLEELVEHFVAAKRSLNSQTHLWHANQLVTAARQLTEENAIVAAKTSAIRNMVDEEVDKLEAVRRGIHLLEADTQREYKTILHNLDVARSGLESTFKVLQETPLEAALQPPGTPQKYLYDTIETAGVTHLHDKLRACIDRWNAGTASVRETEDAFNTALNNLQSSIDSVPSTPTRDYSPGRIPTLYYELEEHAREVAQQFQMLVRHYDLCVTALRATEGGADAATEAVGDAPQPSGQDTSGPPVPLSEEERLKVLTIVKQDASEVEDVVADIRGLVTEMSALQEQIETHINHQRREDAALGGVLRMMARVAAEARSHVERARSFQTAWLEDIRPTLLEGIDEWEEQREFFENFDLAYAELLVEVASRRRRYEKIKRKAEEAQRELDKLYAEEERAREQFMRVQGRFLPRDIWPGLHHPPRKYEVRPVDRVGDEQEPQKSTEIIPQLARNVVERALTRVKRRM